MCLVLWDTPTAACDMMGSMAASPFSADRGESTLSDLSMPVSGCHITIDGEYNVY